ncbi:MAG TPA: cytidylate kinase, partial [Clostridiales bacterium]|nr:cytidylate kinase [Clostridiales bacterium]
MNQRIVIAINREYGSGGKTIGEMLGKELGIPFYNKEILR